MDDGACSQPGHRWGFTAAASGSVLTRAASSRASCILCVSTPAGDPGASRLNLLQFGFSRHNDRAAKSPRADGDWGGCWRARWQLQGILGYTGHSWLRMDAGWSRGVQHQAGSSASTAGAAGDRSGLQLSHSSSGWWPRGWAGWGAAGAGDLLLLPGWRDPAPCLPRTLAGQAGVQLLRDLIQEMKHPSTAGSAVGPGTGTPQVYL